MYQTIDAYLDAARARLDLPSDRQLAGQIKITPQTLNGWRTKRAWPADHQMIHIADLAGVERARALADLNTWRTKSPEARAEYSRIARLVAAAAGAVLLAALLAVPTGTKAAQINADNGFSVYYGKFISNRHVNDHAVIRWLDAGGTAAA